MTEQNIRENYPEAIRMLAAKRSEDRDIEIREKVWPLKLAAAYRARG